MHRLCSSRYSDPLPGVEMTSLRTMVGALGRLAQFLNRRARLAVALCLVAALPTLVGLGLHLVLVGDGAARAGVDLRLYVEAASRWLHGGDFYPAWQLSGPYPIPKYEYRLSALPILYPPPALLLFAPFAVLPWAAPLWWAIPLAVTLGVVVALRPAPWTWPLLAILTLDPDTFWLVWAGNPIIWCVAALALALRWPASSVLILIKPTLAPFALVGIRRRAWWLGMGGGAVAALAFAPMWSSYLAALGNISETWPTYFTSNLPAMLIPLVAWAGRQKPAAAVG